ncbi:MAG TPA: hypothetical protein VN714_10775 [Trebonia sp.]|nr:hypothetical protein [Trebonia sp.]
MSTEAGDPELLEPLGGVRDPPELPVELVDHRAEFEGTLHRPLEMAEHAQVALQNW